MSVLQILSERNDEWMKKCLQITKNQLQAEELLQEFYLKIGEKEARGTKIKLGDKHDNYVRKILINLNSDMKAREKKEKEECDITTFTSISTDENWCDNLPEDLSELQEMEILEEVLLMLDKDLSKHEFTVGLLNFWYKGIEGKKMSYQKISDFTGISLRKVRTSVVKAREMIRVKYADEYKKLPKGQPLPKKKKKATKGKASPKKGN